MAAFKLVTIPSPRGRLTAFEHSKLFRSVMYGVLALVAYGAAWMIEEFVKLHGATLPVNIAPFVAAFAPVVVAYLRKVATNAQYTVLVNPDTYETVKEVGHIPNHLFPPDQPKPEQIPEKSLESNESEVITGVGQVIPGGSPVVDSSPTP